MASYLWPPKVGGTSAGVASVNSLSGSLFLVGGSGVIITPSGGDTFTFDIDSAVALLLDQTVPQTVINGAPIFDEGVEFTNGATIDPAAYQIGVSSGGGSPLFIQTPSDSTPGNSGKWFNVLTGDGAQADVTYTGGLGGFVNLTAGVGGAAAEGLNNGGTGGLINLTAGVGGAGTASNLSGGGGNINLYAGAGGADGGGGSGGAGSVSLITSNSEFTVAEDAVNLIIADNSSTAFTVYQSVDRYLNIDTSNGAEQISLGNAVTNPDYNFLGSGDATFSADVVVDGSTGKTYNWANETTAPSNPVTPAKWVLITINNVDYKIPVFL